MSKAMKRHVCHQVQGHGQKLAKIVCAEGQNKKEGLGSVSLPWNAKASVKGNRKSRPVFGGGEWSRWAMKCTASFQLMRNTSLSRQERSFAPQREKYPPQENQRCPLRLNGHELIPFPHYREAYLLCVSPSTFHPEAVSPIYQCQLGLWAGRPHWI